MTDHRIIDDLLARAQVIDGLRQLADYLAAHPEVLVNEYGRGRSADTSRCTDAAERAAFDQVTPVRDDTNRAPPGVSSRLAFDLLGPTYATPDIA